MPAVDRPEDDGIRPERRPDTSACLFAPPVVNAKPKAASATRNAGSIVRRTRIVFNGSLDNWELKDPYLGERKTLLNDFTAKSK
mmetsp:Transcript_11247/g.25218  ORF Transcript_11247/g.25218 Transcript_11247/m.25218 type:complete len:84 (-) Transcript_11247:128-379(-)